MITKKELQEYLTITNFTLWQAERDYLQHLFLYFLSHHTGSNLVFKGGTALQKAYKLPRFSIDLDFTLNDETDPTTLIMVIAKGMVSFGYPVEVKEVITIGKTFVLRIQGPLYQGSALSVAVLKIEISQREFTVLPPKLVEMNPLYPDLSPYTILVMQPEEIAAEKIRAIATRNKSRDIFDLHFLLREGVEIKIDFINRKLAYYKERYDKKKIIEKIKTMKALWDKEMKNYISDVPDFEKVAQEIIEKL